MNKFSIEYAIDLRTRIKAETDKSLRIISCYQQDQFHFPEQNILPSPRHITAEGLGFSDEELNRLCRGMLSLIENEKDTAHEYHAGKLLYDTFRNLSPRDASDIGFWSYLSHRHLYQYIIKRWPMTGLSQEKIKSNIINHWHFENQAQASLIDHTLAGLWWSFYITEETEDGKDNKDWELTKIYFGHAAFRTKYLGQSKTGRHKEAVLGALKFIKANNLNIGNYEENARAIAPYLNLLGGTRPLGYFDRQWFYDRLEERFRGDIQRYGRLFRREEKPD